MKKTVLISFITLFLTLIVTTSFTKTPKLTIRFFKNYTKNIEVMPPIPLLPISKDDALYASRFWKVYYDESNRLYGSEYFVNFKLIYYYRYFYDKNKNTLVKGYYNNPYIKPMYYKGDTHFILFTWFYNTDQHVTCLYDANNNLLQRVFFKPRS